jgi:hypothetical protein
MSWYTGGPGFVDSQLPEEVQVEIEIIVKTSTVMAG